MEFVLIVRNREIEMFKLGAGIVTSLLASVAFAQPKIANQAVIPGYTPPTSAGVPVEGPAEVKKVATPVVVHPAPAPLLAPLPVSGLIVTNQATISPEEKSKWINYFNDLRNCKPSTYILNQINPALASQYGKFVTNKIISQDNDKCRLTIMYYKEDDPRLRSIGDYTSDKNKIMQYPSGLECRLSKPAVESLIATDADFLSGKPVNPAGDIFSKVVAQECLPYVMINGQQIIVSPLEGGPGEGYNF